METLFSRNGCHLFMALTGSIVCSVNVMAQEEKPKAKNSETVKVIGSRTEGRKAVDSAAPVDFLFGDDLVNQGDTDVSNILRTFVPSYNVTTQPISDASTMIRPANLRGLPPDSTLVLVNGKRRHRSAVISFLGQGLSDGSQGPDISVIPAIALKSVEVLRDGAAAQYGSDAIAGVMNFVLKDSDQGGAFQVKYGQFYKGDGETAEYSANVGFPLLAEGFGNISLEYSNSAATDRSVQRDDAKELIAAGNDKVASPAQAWGQPEVKDNLKLFANFGQDINSHLSLYALGNYATRRVEGGFYYRNPDTRDGVYSNDDGKTRLVGDLQPNNGMSCPVVAVGDSAAYDQIADNTTAIGAECFAFNEMFPGGFTPRFGGNLRDVSGVMGVRGELPSGVHYDLSGSVGLNHLDFFIKNTVNATLGPDTPTSFKPGSYIQREKQFNFDLSYPLPLEIFASPLNIAGGIERRQEQFQIKKGDEASYAIGPLASQGFGIGSNGFSGFSPDVAGTFSRWNSAVYLDLETDITQDFLFGVAGRWEDFEDFGATSNGKVSMRYRFNPNLSIRSTASSGFRAPTPGQSNVTNISTTFENGKLANRGTIPPTNPIAKLKGGQQLQPEKSNNFSFGSIVTADKFRASLDYFSIQVRDRITQSASQSLTPEEAAQLEADGIAGASGLESFRFYTNGFRTRTQGVDLVMSHPVDVLGGQTAINFNGNWTKTKVESYTPGILDAKRIRQIEEGLPAVRYNIAANSVNGPWRNLLRLNYFGKFFEAHLDDESFPIKAGDEYTVDVETAYSINSNLTVAVGAQNLLNEYPDEHPYQGVAGAQYPETSPMGFNGGFYYTRLAYTF